MSNTTTITLNKMEIIELLSIAAAMPEDYIDPSDYNEPYLYHQNLMVLHKAKRWDARTNVGDNIFIIFDEDNDDD